MAEKKKVDSFGLSLDADKVRFLPKQVAAGVKLSERDKQFMIRRDRAHEEAARSEQRLGGACKNRRDE